MNIKEEFRNNKLTIIAAYKYIREHQSNWNWFCNYSAQQPGSPGLYFKSNKFNMLRILLLGSEMSEISNNHWIVTWFSTLAAQAQGQFESNYLREMEISLCLSVPEIYLWKCLTRTLMVIYDYRISPLKTKLTIFSCHPLHTYDMVISVKLGYTPD